MRSPISCLALAGAGAALVSCSPSRAAPAPAAALTGQAAMGDWTTDAPGVRRKLVPADLPAPYATASADNGATIVPRPAGALPRVPDGFVVDLLTTEVAQPRMIRTAPNGDVFVVESAAGRVKVVRGADRDGAPERVTVFATGLRQPFGIGFYPPAPPRWVYVANTDPVGAFPYTHGGVTARGGPQAVFDNRPGGGRRPRGVALTR